MKRYLWILCLAAAPALAAGCATSEDVKGVERQTATINAELREIKGNLDEINFSLQAQTKKVKDLQETQNSCSDSQKSIAEELAVIKRNQADMGSKMFTMEGGEVKGVSGQIDELRHDMQEQAAKLDALKAALLQRLDSLEQAARQAQAGQGQPQAAQSGSQPSQPEQAQTQTPAGDPTQMYQSAKLDYTKGNFDVAILGFKEYLKSFPDGEYAANSQYWIGESYYSQGKYEDALAEFDKVITGYPTGNKVPDAMLKKGYCYEALAKPMEARAQFEALVKQFPASDAAKLAGEKLKKK